MYAHDAECLDRVASTIEVLRGKWTVQILCVLVDGRLVLVASGGSCQRRPRRP
jgi:DNA-binding HxlR family transcriptional regulator